MQNNPTNGEKCNNKSTHTSISACMPMTYIGMQFIDKKAASAFKVWRPSIEFHEIQNLHHGWRYGKPYLHPFIHLTINLEADALRTQNVADFLKHNPNFIPSMLPQFMDNNAFFNLLAALHFYTHLSSTFFDINAFFTHNHFIVSSCSQYAANEQQRLFMLLYTAALFAHKPQSLDRFQKLLQEENGDFYAATKKIYNTVHATPNHQNCHNILTNIAKNLWPKNAMQINLNQLHMLDLQMLLQVLSFNNDVTLHAKTALHTDYNFFPLLATAAQEMCNVFCKATEEPSCSISSALHAEYWQMQVTHIQQAIYNISYGS